MMKNSTRNPPREGGLSHSHQVSATKRVSLGAEKLTPEEQRRRFIEAAREAGASEDESEFDANLKKIAQAKVPDPKR